MLLYGQNASHTDTFVHKPWWPPKTQNGHFQLQLKVYFSTVTIIETYYRRRPYVRTSRRNMLLSLMLSSVLGKSNMLKS